MDRIPLVFCSLLLLCGVGYSIEPEDLFHNIGYIGYGYHQFLGNPHASSIDPGFKSPIFDTTDYSEARMSSDDRYRVPNGVDAHSTSSCNSQFTSQAVTDENTFSKVLQTSVNADFVGVPFSANAEFQSISKKTRTENNVFVESMSVCEQYVASILAFDPPKKTENFKVGADQLPKRFNDSEETREKYFNFFERFGTHVVTKIWMGARVVRRYQLEAHTFAKLVGQGVKVAAAASVYSAGVMGRAALKTEFERSQSSRFEEYHAACSEFALGTVIPTNPENNLWFGILDKPAPVRYTLARISDFVEPELHDEVVMALLELCKHVKNALCESLPKIAAPYPMCPEMVFPPKFTKAYSSCTFGVSETQANFPSASCSVNQAMRGVRFQKLGNSFKFNIGCASRADIALHGGSWGSPMRLKNVPDKSSHLELHCPAGHFASGIGFTKYCGFNTANNAFARIFCVRSMVNLGEMYQTDWMKTMENPRPSFKEFSCPEQTVMTGIDFKGRSVGTMREFARVTCRAIGPPCTTFDSHRFW